MATLGGLCSRTLQLARLASHSQACCLSADSIAASVIRNAEQLRSQAGFSKPGGDTSKQRKQGPREGPGDVNPRLQALVELLTSPTRQTVDPPTPKEQAALAAYKELEEAKAFARAEDMAVKFHLQQAALKALPQRLRELASQPDHTPFPMNRNCLFDTPPEAYRDAAPGTEPAAKAEKARSTGR